MSLPPDGSRLHITLSGDVYLKSRKTQRGLIARFRRNLELALEKAGHRGDIERIGTHRFSIAPPVERRAAVVDACSTVFGVASIDTVIELPFEDFDGLVDAVADASADRVRGRSFAVRSKRRGNHSWKSPDLARAVGSQLVARGGTVDLTNPDVEVSVRVLDGKAFLVTDHVAGPGGLPLGTQDRVLCLLSGGFDSVVAAWMLMSRGCPVDFVHFSLNCAQSDHALAVARELWDTWGHGTDPTVHLVEFQPVKDALFADVETRLRQVTLKVMMARAAEEIADSESVPALLTGDSVGQVSSQTIPHLVAVSRAVQIPVLRPLSGLPKEHIIALARQVGTAELSARAQEVCDLSEGQPVATSATGKDIDRSVEQIPNEVLADALTTAKKFKLRDWSPGQI